MPSDIELITGTGWYWTRYPCQCTHSAMSLYQNVWSCESCGNSRTNPDGCIPELSHEFRWQQSKLFRLHRVKAVRLSSHPLGITKCRRGCGYSPGRQWLAVSRISANGIRRAMVFCACCGVSNPERLIAKKDLDPTDLPVFNDCPWCDGDGCEKCTHVVLCDHKECESTAVEYHHYMPRSLAADHGVDADNYPVLPLCPQHHREWHRIVTPDISRKAADGRQ